MEILLYWWIIGSVWSIGLYIIHKLDKPDWLIAQKEYRMLALCSAINAIVIFSFSPVEGWKKLQLAVFAGCLILACITDCKAYEVYQFIWWMANVVSVLLLCVRLCGAEALQIHQWGTLLLYCVLQECFFSKFYGRADCHAFAACALVAFGLGMELLDCLIHMLLAFGGLAIVQFVRRNISKKGNLKQPVAFLPYITIAFWVNLCCFSLKKMVY